MAYKLTRREFERRVGLTLVGSSAFALGAQAGVDPLVAGRSSSDGQQAEGKKEINRGEPEDLKPWADVVAQKWANASKAIILTDLSPCQPASALSPEPKRGHWKVIPYELAGGRKGNLLWATADQGAPPVRLPLGVKGWHALSVGIYATVSAPSTVWLKLDGDMAAQPRTTAEFRPYGSFTEVFFKVAELDGGALQIEQQSAGLASAAGLVWVKLIPLTPDEIIGFLADRDQHSTRRLAATNDIGFLGSRRPTTVEEILREVEAYRHTDFGTLLLHMPGADLVSYPSRCGHPPPRGPEGFVYPGPDYKYWAEAVAELAKKGINPVKVMIEGAHAVGMKVHVAIRPALWTYYEPLTEFFDSPFYRAHPEWRCVDRDDTPVARMSWAVPEVRKHLIDVLREAVGFGADGAHLVFCRGVPIVLYEPQFLEIFEKRYGEDPRKLDEESDPRIKQARAEVVTTFMRELRAMLDQEQARRNDGKHLESSAMIFGNEYDNMLYGIDVRRWVAEGLIDEIFTYRWNIGPKKAVEDPRFYLDICRPKGVRYHVGLTLAPGYTKLEEVISWYQQGVGGFSFFDAGGIFQNNSQWPVFTRLGHVDELRLRRQEEVDGKERPVQIQFHKLGNEIMDGRFPPMWGG